MKISVIVPVYNAERYLDKLVQSVLSQTYEDYELILVDDSSKDNSYLLMKNTKKWIVESRRTRKKIRDQV